MIGREREKARLLSAFQSEQSEFVAVFGRRRVGKTYLIRETFDGDFAFQHTGIARGTTREQLRAFCESLGECGNDCPVPKDWFDAFRELKKVISASLAVKKVVFIDEMPYLDTKGSRFIPALEHFWNGWASARKDVLLIVCGSATSWIINKVIHDKGGLHNRVTERIAVKPFTLRECELYAKSRGVIMTRPQLAEMYMILGGIPYYWKWLQPDLSPAQNIDEMFFAGNHQLEDEFEELYASLFRQSAPYIRIVTALGCKKVGMLREELAKSIGLKSCGTLTHYLRELEHCGFIRKYAALGCESRGSVYQLVDNFTLFYFRFLANRSGHDRHYWSSALDTQEHVVWAGLAFERLCLQHIDQIKQSLGISGVASSEYAWRSRPTGDRPGVQIDMLIDRRDGVINLCEMKYAESPYEVTAEDDRKLRVRREVLKSETGTRKAIHVTLVTLAGVRRNAYTNNIQSFVDLDALFG